MSKNPARTKRRNLFTLRKRSFLNPVSTGHTSCILAEVESSNDGDYKWGHYMLTIGDCHRQPFESRNNKSGQVDILIGLTT